MPLHAFGFVVEAYTSGTRHSLHALKQRELLSIVSGASRYDQETSNQYRIPLLHEIIAGCDPGHLLGMPYG